LNDLYRLRLMRECPCRTRMVECVVPNYVSDFLCFQGAHGFSELSLGMESAHNKTVSSGITSTQQEVIHGAVWISENFLARLYVRIQVFQNRVSPIAIHDSAPGSDAGLCR